MTKQMADSVASMKEYNRFSKGLFSFVGFKTKWLEYENIERVAGETKWSFWKLFKYALEGIDYATSTQRNVKIHFVIAIIVLIFSLFCFSVREIKRDKI